MDSTTFGLFIGALVLLLMASLVFAFNDLVGKRIQSRNAWSEIDVQLNRRYDLIPKLVETLRPYAAHERETFERVIQARKLAGQAEVIPQRAQAENMLTATLKSLFAVAAAYPELHTNESFLRAQEGLSAAENQLATAHERYNEVVGQYNASLERVPTNLVATWFGFKPIEFFELQPPGSSEMAALR